MSNFASRTVVVTGGARGIGEAVAGAFLEQGAQVVSIDISDSEEPLESVTYLRADISSPESIRDAFAEIKRVDVLVNNAGIQQVGLVGELTAEKWEAVVGVNLNGAFYCSTAAIPLMRRQGSGAIVNVASVAAFKGIPGRGPYTAAKAGLLGLTRVMAVELAPVGIRVNAVAPGFTRTPLVEEALRNGSLREDWMLERVPLGRLAAPAEIARIVRFLASDDASYVTGQAIIADGGWAIQGIGFTPDWLTAPTDSGG